MSGAKDFATLGALVMLVAGGVWMSAMLDKKPQVTEAIKAELALFIEVYADPTERKAVDDKPASLCIASNEPLDFKLLAEPLTGYFLRTVPVADCTSKTVEGDLGMFSAMTTWFDESGEQSGNLEIEAVHCLTARRCFVDIDPRGAGMRYEVELACDDWAVTKSSTRWIV